MESIIENLKRQIALIHEDHMESALDPDGFGIALSGTDAKKLIEALESEKNTGTVRGIPPRSSDTGVAKGILPKETPATVIDEEGTWAQDIPVLRCVTFVDISEEMDRQIQKWGVQNHKPIEYCAILGEEVGEVNKEALEHHFEYPPTDGPYPDRYTEEVVKLKRYRKELIQVAAVAISMILCVDRNELKGYE